MIFFYLFPWYIVISNLLLIGYVLVLKALPGFKSPRVEKNNQEQD